VLLIGADDIFAAHETGRGHPERAGRLIAVREGIKRSGVTDSRRSLTVRAASRDELIRVHSPEYLDALQQRCEAGGGRLDPDTVASSGSWQAARVAAGTGLAAIEALDAGAGDAAFCALRPPGHHAVADRAMGFCLINNVAVAAAALAERGERVCVVDFDAHHGNGTQDMFWTDPRVLYVSMHQWPLYPGSGRLDECGAGAGAGTTVNLPFPAGTTGDVYLRAMDEVVTPVLERFDPTWLRAPSRSAHRPRSHLRRFRRYHLADHRRCTGARSTDRVPRGRLQPRRSTGLRRRDAPRARWRPVQPAGTGHQRRPGRTGRRCGSRRALPRRLTGLPRVASTRRPATGYRDRGSGIEDRGSGIVQVEGGGRR